MKTLGGIHHGQAPAASRDGGGGGGRTATASGPRPAARRADRGFAAGKCEVVITQRRDERRDATDDIGEVESRGVEVAVAHAPLEHR